MSFRELLPPHIRDSWRFGTQQSHPPSPSIRVVAAESYASPESISSPSPKSRRKKYPPQKEKAARDWKDRRVQSGYSSASTTSSSSSSSSSSTPTEDPMDRCFSSETTQFSLLNREVKHFQKMVSDLHNLVPKAGDSPEIAWRVQILTKSLQDSDQTLAHRLNDYEQTLMTSSRTKHPAQWSACRKLHRDYHRSHHTLRRCLELYRTRQRAEISQLYAVPWNQQQRQHDNKNYNQEDYFDRVMRQKELEKMNQSMHQVNDIYRELAQMIDQQQDDIDILERDIGTAAMNVESAAQHIHCFAAMDRMYLCGGGGVEACASSGGGILGEFSPRGTRGFDATVSFSDEQFQSPRRIHDQYHQQHKVHRVGEDFHCMMPFETIQEDLGMVRQDIAQVGKNIWRQGEQVRHQLLGKNIH